MRNSRANYYEVLQVSQRAEPEVLEAAYRRLARKYHPDLNSEPGAGERMRQINQAYTVLSDPVRRAAYDGLLASRRAARPTLAAGTSRVAAADRRQRPSGVGWRRLTLAFAILAGVAGVVVLVSGAADSNAVSLRPNSGARKPTPTAPGNAVMVPAKYSAHGFLLTIHRDGNAEVTWRTDQACNPGVESPCDRRERSNIVDTGQADLRFLPSTSSSADAVDGYVLMSTDARMVGPASLKLLPYDMAQLRTPDGVRTLCGPRFAQEAPASVKRSDPCGISP